MRRTTASSSSWLLVVGVGACFFATGAAGLIYEIAWNRMLALLMGNTPYALATLLTVFMGGLALGAWIGGRWAPRGPWALRTYGLLEIGIGLYCLALPLLLNATSGLFGSIYRDHYSSLFAFNVMQFCVVGALLLIPTTMMGATLPILVQFLVTQLGVMSRTVGVLYGANSGGAFAGAMLAGLVLLPSIGLQASVHVAVAVNAVVGVVALALSFRGAPEVEAAGPAPAPAKKQKAQASALETADAPAPRFSRTLLLVAFGLSGAAAMIYQVAWTRAITLSIGSSTYAFTLIAGSFILGLTLGSFFLAWIGDRPYGQKAASILAAIIALSALMTVVLLGELPVRMTQLVRSAETYSELEWAKFRAIFFMFLASTTCMGGLLPIVCRWMARTREDAGQSVGNAYAANALGAIVGSFCGGFVFIPLVGMRGSILVGAGISLVVAALFAFVASSSRRLGAVGWLGAIALVGVIGLSLAPGWDPAVMISGPFAKGRPTGRAVAETEAEIAREMHADTIIHYREGVTTVVAVKEDKAQKRTLVIGGKPDAFSYASTQNWLGQLPMLLRPDARRVLVVGLGSGSTLGAVECHLNVEAIDCVEISPEVISAAREFFGKFTGDALADSRLDMIQGDGRLHLEHTDRAYDVVISQPSNPWMAGSSALFTRECFELMHRRLKAGGIACIWFQGFSMPLENFQILARTWADTWKHPSIWTSRIAGEHLFVGSDEPLAIDYAALEARLADPRVKTQMALISMPTPADVLGYLVATDEGAHKVGGTGPLNTDDNSRIEYDTPKGMWRDHTSEILAVLHAQRIDPWNYVVAPANSASFTENRERGARILADQSELMRALPLPPNERRGVLEGILKRNPNDATAARELKRTPGN